MLSKDVPVNVNGINIWHFLRLAASKALISHVAQKERQKTLENIGKLCKILRKFGDISDLYFDQLLMYYHGKINLKGETMRLGTKRVDEVLDYERDIKGKGLIRLSAGVGSGKNYWARHLPESHPELQILLITSRKNVAQAEALQLDIDCKIHYSKLLDLSLSEQSETPTIPLTICTNAYIKHFFETNYDEEKPETYLWNKFNLIIVDEAHSLVADSSFADSSFYVTHFIMNSRAKNPNCDIILMTGTPDIMDELFTDEYFGEDYEDLNLYDQCVRLIPDEVHGTTLEETLKQIQQLWNANQRLIYFVTTVKRMAELISDLKQLGIQEEAIGIAYSESENEELLPENLRNKKEDLRKYIIENARIPENIRIFISTSQNKEGINIIDDDIKYMFAESHNHADLIQMAGRVRGNPETGSGLYSLGIVYGIAGLITSGNYIDQHSDKVLIGYLDEIVKNHELEAKEHGKNYSCIDDIKHVHKKHEYIRYDYMSKKFCYWNERVICSKINAVDKKSLTNDFMQAYLTNESFFIDYDVEPMLEPETKQEIYPLIEKDIAIPVKEECTFSRYWFPNSQCFVHTGDAIEMIDIVKIKLQAHKELMVFLEENAYWGVWLNEDQQKEVLLVIQELIRKYGAEVLGFSAYTGDTPKRLGTALKKLGLATKLNKKNTKKQIIPLKTLEINEKL